GADRDRRDAAGASGIELRYVFAAAAAMVDAAGRSGAAGLSRIPRDGPWDGRGCGSVHRADRVGTAADGRTQCESRLRLCALLHAGDRTGAALYRAGAGGRAYQDFAAFGRMARMDRAALRLRAGRAGALFSGPGGERLDD